MIKVPSSMTTGLAESAHTHAIADVTNLQTSLDGKAASSHTHSAADITSGSLSIDRIGAGAITADKLAQVLTFATVKASTSGTTVDFTGIPSWAKRITVILAGVSASGTDQLWLRIGDSVGFKTSGYEGSCTTGSGTTAALQTGAFIISSSQVASDVRSGVVTLVRITGNQWVLSGYLSSADASGSGRLSAGQATLSGTLTQIQVLTAGTNTFDAGSINISYEG